MAGLNSFICKYFSKSLVFYERHFGKFFRPNVASTTVDAKVVFFFRGGVWGGGAVLIISKNLPFRGKFFEMIKKKKTSKNIFPWDNATPTHRTVQPRGEEFCGARQIACRRAALKGKLLVGGPL